MYFKNVYRRLSSVNILILLAAVLGAAPVFAQVKVGLDFSSVQEKRSSSQISSIGITFIDTYLHIGFKKELPLQLTLGYLNITSVENYADSSYSKLISTLPYVGLVYQFWSKNPTSLIVGGFYSPYAKLGVSEDAGQEVWQGTSMISKLTGSFSLSAKFKLNVGLYYISETFGSRISGSVTSKSSFSQSYVAPSIGIAVAF